MESINDYRNHQQAGSLDSETMAARRAATPTLPKDVAEGIPPQEDLWTNAPGELVWVYNADPKEEQSGMTGLSWQVRRLIPGVHEPAVPGLQAPKFEASTPYRASVYRGDTPEEALGYLLKGMALLSREGAINPSSPYYPGAPPIQHAIHFLTERLLCMVERRQNHLVMSGYAEHPAHVGAVIISASTGETKEDEQTKKAREAHYEELNEQMMRAVARDNEVVSALATAVAALARVKDL